MTNEEFQEQYFEYKQLLGKAEKIEIKPILNEDKGGFDIDGHYHYQDVWAFDKIIDRKPKSHIDYGSRVSWLELVARFTDITYYDLFLPKISESRITYAIGSVTDTHIDSDSIDSLSSLHVIEHIGLGRYGDELDPKGTEKACRELARILKPGGRLLVSLPVGRERTVFNAHRITDPERIIDWCSGLKLIELSGSHVNLPGGNKAPTNLIRNVDIKLLKNSDYACGLYEFSK